MKINWKVRFKNPVFWFNLAASIFLPMLACLGAVLYRTQTIQHRLIFSGSLHSCGGRYFVFSNPFEIIYFHSPPYSYLFLIFPFFLAAPIFYSLRLC